MVKRPVVLAVFAGLVGSAAAKPDAQRLVGVKLQGPAKSLAASCAAAPACGQVDMAGTRPKKPDCAAVDQGDLHHAVGSNAEVWIAPVGCAVPDGIHATEREYHVFVRRGDTWWRGDVLQSTEERHTDFDDLQVTWDDRDGRVVARVEVTHNSYECFRARSVENQTTYDLMVDPRAATPVVYPKLAVGAHFGPGPGDDNADMPDCPKTEVSTTALTERWVGSDRVELSGDDRATGSAAGPHAGAYQLVAP
jgi:hypothetical protein